MPTENVPHTSSPLRRALGPAVFFVWSTILLLRILGYLYLQLDGSDRIIAVLAALLRLGICASVAAFCSCVFPQAGRDRPGTRNDSKPGRLLSLRLKAGAILFLLLSVCAWVVPSVRRVAPALLDWVAEGDIGFWGTLRGPLAVGLAWGMLLFSAGFMGHALSLLLSSEGPAEGSISRFCQITRMAWLLLTAANFYSWPACIDFQGHTWVFVANVGMVLVFPGIFASQASCPERWESPVRLYASVVSALGLVALGIFLAVSLSQVYAAVENVDFFFYVCFARDLEAGIRSVSPARYLYFPGVYWFWRLACRWTGTDLNGLHLVYLGAVLLNVGLLMGIVRQSSGKWMLSLFSGCLYLAAMVPFEGLKGLTEPLATLFLLAGIFCWAGRPFDGSGGLVRAFGLGAGMGLAVFMKQQAALSVLGGVFFFALQGIFGNRWRLAPRALLAVPAAALLVFLSSVLLEGRGLEPIVTGLRLASQYPSHYSFLENLKIVFHGNGNVMAGFLCAALSWLVLAMVSRIGLEESGPSDPLLAFSLCAGALALLQFNWRNYHHYALLWLPFAVLALAAAVQKFSGIYSRNIRMNMLAGPLLPAIGLFLVLPQVVWINGLRRELAAHREHSLSPCPMFKHPDVRSDLLELKQAIRPGQELLVLPPCRNDLHFALGTVSAARSGYVFGFRDMADFLANVDLARLQAILVTNRRFDEIGRFLWQRLDCDGFVSELPALGFHPAVELPTLTLWQKK